VIWVEESQNSTIKHKILGGSTENLVAAGGRVLCLAGAARGTTFQVAYVHNDPADQKLHRYKLFNDQNSQTTSLGSCVTQKDIEVSLGNLIDLAIDSNNIAHVIFRNTYGEFANHGDQLLYFNQGMSGPVNLLGTSGSEIEGEVFNFGSPLEQGGGSVSNASGEMTFIYDLCIVVDSQNNPHIVWKQIDLLLANDPPLVNHLYYRKIIPQGNLIDPYAKQDVASLAEASSNSYPSLAIDSQDNLSLVWVYNETSNIKKLRYKQKLVNQSTWQGSDIKYKIDGSWEYVYIGTVNVDSQDNVCLAWEKHYTASVQEAHKESFIYYTVDPGSAAGSVQLAPIKRLTRPIQHKHYEPLPAKKRKRP